MRVAAVLLCFVSSGLAASLYASLDSRADEEPFGHSLERRPLETYDDTTVRSGVYHYPQPRLEYVNPLSTTDPLSPLNPNNNLVRMNSFFSGSTPATSDPRNYQTSQRHYTGYTTDSNTYTTQRYYNDPNTGYYYSQTYQTPPDVSVQQTYYNVPADAPAQQTYYNVPAGTSGQQTPYNVPSAPAGQQMSYNVPSAPAGQQTSYNVPSSGWAPPVYTHYPYMSGNQFPPMYVNLRRYFD